MVPWAVTSITSSGVEKIRRSPFIFWTALLLVALTSSLLPGAPLLGEWESLTIFTTFGSQVNSLSLHISPAANIGGQGYPLLESSRHIIELLQLPYTIDVIRLPAKVIGASGLIAFGVVTRRWFGSGAAIAATALLAINPIFHQYQNELIIAGPSFVALIVLLERLQFLSSRPSSWFGWITMSFAWMLLLTMYGPSRIYSTVLVAVWLAMTFVKAIRNRDEFSVGPI